MLTKVNVVSEVNALGQLFVYKKIARLNEHVLSLSLIHILTSTSRPIYMKK